MWHGWDFHAGTSLQIVFIQGAGFSYCAMYCLLQSESVKEPQQVYLVKLQRRVAEC